jgi:hypothetical protein
MAKAIIAFVLIAILAAAFIIGGFSTKSFDNYHVKQTGESYVTAEYSERVCRVSINVEDGMPYTSCRTSYWDKRVSTIWAFVAHNGKLQNSSTPASNLKQDDVIIRIIGMPDATIAHDKSNLIGYNHSLNYNYFLVGNDDSGHYYISEKEYKQIIGRKGDTVKVKLWYSFVREIQ